jgi:hypothetical protein
MEEEGVQTASSAENKRKREQTVKRKEEKERLLAKANVLVVIAETSNFKFKMPLNPSGKFKDAHDSIPKRFETWIKKGENNFDALLLSGAGKGKPLFEFKECSPGSEDKEAELEGPIGLWAFRLREKLGNTGGMTDENTLRFTTSTTFYDNVLNQPERQAKRIAANYQYVILADEYRVGKTGRMGHEQILDFCALHLIKRQVCIYPPLSLMYALSDKHGVRDPMLVDVMLPHVRMTAKATISESAGEAAKYLMEKEPGRNYDHLVAKVNTSCSAMGVFFVKKTGSNSWTATNGGSSIGDENGKEKNGIEEGEMLRWEPYLEVLKREEWRMFKYMKTNYTVSGLVPLYTVQTELMDTGEIHVEKPPAPLEGLERTKDLRMKMNKICRKTIELLRESGHSAWHGIQDLVFRFDMVLDGDKVYLNEIDLFPLAVSFLDEYITCEEFVGEMGACACRYMKDHSRDNEAWPM